MRALDEYLANPPSGTAILVEGPWGVGKSYWWNGYTQGWEASERIPITMSAAGLKTYDDLELALFQASITDIGTETLREAATIFGRALLRYAKVDPADIKLKAEVFSGKTVICIDDIERFAGEFRILFGFILNLLDRNGLHCVLLADEVQAKAVFHDDYGAYKERIVGRTLRLKARTQDFVLDTVRGFEDGRARALLEPKAKALANRLAAWNVANLRTVRQYLTELSSILKRSDVQDGADLDPLLSAVAFWRIAESADARHTEDVATVFATPTFEIAYSLNRSSRDVPSNEPQSDLDRVAALIDQLGFADDLYGWPTSLAFSHYVLGEDPDYAAIAADFGLNAQPSAVPPGVALLRKLNQYRELSDEALQQVIEAARAHVATGHENDLGLLFDLFRTLYWLSTSRLMGVSPEAWTAEVLASLNLYEERLSPDMHHHLENGAGELDPNERRVRERIAELGSQIQALSWAQTQEAFFIAIETGDGELPDLVSNAPLFRNVDVASFYQRLRRGGVQAIGRFGARLRSARRVSNARDSAGEDANFYEALANHVEQHEPTSDIVGIVDAEFALLANDLRGFVAQLRLPPGSA